MHGRDVDRETQHRKTRKKHNMAEARENVSPASMPSSAIVRRPDPRLERKSNQSGYLYVYQAGARGFCVRFRDHHPPERFREPGEAAIFLEDSFADQLQDVLGVEKNVNSYRRGSTIEVKWDDNMWYRGKVISCGKRWLNVKFDAHWYEGCYHKGHREYVDPNQIATRSIQASETDEENEMEVEVDDVEESGEAGEEGEHEGEEGNDGEDIQVKRAIIKTAVRKMKELTRELEEMKELTSELEALLD